MKSKLILIILGTWLLAAGCAASGSSEVAIRPQTPPYSGMGVPPSFYNYDPALEYWFTPPYFDPYVGHK